MKLILRLHRLKRLNLTFRQKRKALNEEVIQENVRKDQLGIAYRKFSNKPEPNKKKRKFIPHKYVRIGRDSVSNDMNDVRFHI